MNVVALSDSPGKNPGIAKAKTEWKFICLAFIVGMILNIISIKIGNPYIVTGIVLFAGVIATTLRGRYQRPWIFLATIMAANPTNLNTPVACNLLFAFCLLLLSLKHLRNLPTWIYVINILAIMAITLSSVNWLGGAGDVSLKTQIGSAINYLAGPFLLMPVIYSSLAGEKDGRGNFQGLLYFIIIPSTVILFLAYKFGTPVIGEFGDVEHLTTNLTTFKLGNTLFYLIRTQSGFIVTSLICASVASILFQVGTVSRLLAAACLSFNAYLLLVSGSVGSAVAGTCGVVVMLLASMFRINILKYLMMIFLAACLLFVVWNFSDMKIKKYVTKRYEERFTKKGVNAKDRMFIWKKAVGFIEDHPEGIGWTLYIDEIKTYPHNDYFTYAIAYSVLGGLIYLYVVSKIGCSLFLRPRHRLESPHDLAVRMAGLGVNVTVIINSTADHLTANRWYFSVIWSLLWFSYFCNRPAIVVKGYNGALLIDAK